MFLLTACAILCILFHIGDKNSLLNENGCIPQLFFFLSISSSGFHTPAQRLGWTAEGSIYGSDTTHFPLDYRGAEVFLLLTLALLTRAATTPQQLLQTALIAMQKPLTSPLKPRNRVKLNSW